MGGRLSKCVRFCTSISENNKAGAAADTGTFPDQNQIQIEHTFRPHCADQNFAGRIVPAHGVQCNLQ